MTILELMVYDPQEVIAQAARLQAAAREERAKTAQAYGLTLTGGTQ